MDSSQWRQLRAAERFAVALELSGPSAITFWFYAALEHKFRSVTGNVVPGLTLAIVWFFVVAPWTVRRAIALRRPAFDVAVVRRDGPASDRMRYGESLRVTWLLSWRTTLILLTPTMLRAVLDPSFNQVTERAVYPIQALLTLDWADLLLMLTVWIGLAGMWLVGAAVRKRYRDFSIRIKRLDPSAAGSIPRYES